MNISDKRDKIMSPEMLTKQQAIPEEDLIRNILAGDRQLYAVIIRRYNQRLYRAGMAILNDDSEVEDAMQVAYINAYEHLGSFAFKSSFSTWLTRILINECYHRAKKRGRTINMQADNMEKEVQHHHEGDAVTPYTAALNGELKSILDDAIRKLPEIYRSVFVLREIENLNVAETQECLAISEVNVKVRLNRAKAMLRDLLSTYYRKEDILHFHLDRCDRMVGRVMKQIDLP